MPCWLRPWWGVDTGDDKTVVNERRAEIGSLKAEGTEKEGDEIGVQINRVC